MGRKRQGAPTWMVTFADLMALLTTFFVLLLSFSKIDAERYKQIADSMERAFGIQWIKTFTESPSGGNIIGKQPERIAEQEPPQPKPVGSDSTPEAVAPELERHLREQLARPIAEGLLEVTRDRGDVVIRFQHEAAFESGSEVLIPRFRPIIDQIAHQLKFTIGEIVVEGHTDDVPIANQRFRSNWELSAARATSVVHQLMEQGRITPERLVIKGYAETRPLVPNDTAANRARNRRVEIRVEEQPWKEQP